jgi:hypothetical protein
MFDTAKNKGFSKGFKGKRCEPITCFVEDCEMVSFLDEIIIKKTRVFGGKPDSWRGGVPLT